jgi:hypothetical protein
MILVGAVLLLLSLLLLLHRPYGHKELNWFLQLQQ